MNRQPKRPAALLCIIMMLCSGMAWAGEQQPVLLTGARHRDLLKRIKAVQSEIKTIQASFVEERQITDLPTPLRFTGRLYVDRQGFMFLKYLRPVRHIIRMRDDTVLFYVEDSATADVLNLAEVQGMAQRPDIFNWTPENFQGSIWEQADGFRLDDQAQGGNKRKISVLLDPKTLYAKVIHLKDAGGDTTEIVLTGLTVNKPLPRDILNFKLPKGTTINSLTQL